MRTYRAGVIGLGQVGMLYELDPYTLRRYPYPSHTSCYQVHPRTTLVAGCDVDAGKRELFRQRYPAARAYRDAQDMLRTASLDLVSVCVPTPLHATMVRAAVASGVQLVICEKPLGSVVATAADVSELCRKAGVGLLVNYWRRFDESHQTLRRFITDGVVGQLQHLHGFYGRGLLGNGAHLINLWLWLAGPIEWVVGVPGPAELPGDSARQVLLGFTSGATGSLATVSYAAYRLFETDVLGTAGRITVKNEGLDLRLYGIQPNEDVSGARQLIHDGRTIPSTVGMAMYRLVEAAVDCLDTDQRPLPLDVLETLAVLEAIERSVREGGRQVAVDAGALSCGVEP